MNFKYSLIISRLIIYISQIYESTRSPGNCPTIKDFVLQEAHERAFKVNVIGLKEFERERAHIVEQKKESIQTKIQKRNKDQLSNARIHKIALINGSRMKKMEARQKQFGIHIEIYYRYCVKQKPTSIRKLSLTDLNTVSSQNNQQSRDQLRCQNQQFTQSTQSKIDKCLKRDKQFVDNAIQDAKSEFKRLIMQQGIHESIAQVDNNFLQLRKIQGDPDAERVDKTHENSKCFGGVILTSEDGLIVCKNTLDSRVELAFQQMLPVIRKTLFN